jgi:hypothetical protein
VQRCPISGGLLIAANGFKLDIVIAHTQVRSQSFLPLLDPVSARSYFLLEMDKCVHSSPAFGVPAFGVTVRPQVVLL